MTPQTYSASYGLTLNGQVLSNTKPARVFILGVISYGDNVVQLTRNNVTGSLANDHLTLTAGGSSGIPDNTVTAGSLQVTSLLTCATSLQVQANATVVGTLTSNTVNAAQLSVTSSATILGYLVDNKCTQTTGSNQFIACSGPWTVWPNAVADGMIIGTTGHMLFCATTGVNSPRGCYRYVPEEGFDLLRNCAHGSCWWLLRLFCGRRCRGRELHGTCITIRALIRATRNRRRPASTTMARELFVFATVSLIGNTHTVRSSEG